MARTRKIILVVTSFVIVISGSAGIARGLQVAQQQRLNLARIETDCASSVDQDGFGHATTAGGIIRKQAGQISVPCKVKLLAGTTLSLIQVQLSTKNLLIENGDPSESPVHLRIVSSSLSSSEGGFQIKFTSNKSSVIIRDSQFSYPLSIGAAVGQKDSDSGALVHIGNSSFTSTGEDSEGILLVSTGKAILAHNQFQLKSPEDTALLMGSVCYLSKNTHANDRCHGL
jgi:hypothetical protein